MNTLLLLILGCYTQVMTPQITINEDIMPNWYAETFEDLLVDIDLSIRKFINQHEHQAPIYSHNKMLVPRSIESDHFTTWDLSDHYPVASEFVFAVE